MWKSNEIKKLINLYSNESNINIANELGKSKGSIDNKSYRLGLKKSEEYIKERNKRANLIRIDKGGRNLTYNEVKKIAEKYKTKIDFIRGDNSAYSKAIKLGVLNEVCEHMSVLKFSTPQLILQDIMDKLLLSESTYNNRKIIKPYEIDIYYNNFKLGFEYQGLYWHSDVNNNNDTVKVKMCKNKNIILIYIFENTRDYEGDIKKQIINNLSIINSATNKNIKDKDVNNIIIGNIYKKLYNKKELIDLAMGYDSFKLFKKEKLKVYKKLLHLGIVDEATKHMTDKRRRVKITNKEIIKIVKTYDNLSDFRKENLKLYKHIKRNKKDTLIQHLKRKK